MKNFPSGMRLTRGYVDLAKSSTPVEVQLLAPYASFWMRFPSAVGVHSVGRPGKTNMSVGPAARVGYQCAVEGVMWANVPPVTSYRAESGMPCPLSSQ